MRVFIFQNGEEFGPYAWAELESLLWENKIHANDLARFDDSEEWIPVQQLLNAQQGVEDEEEDAVETSEASLESRGQETAVITEEALLSDETVETWGDQEEVAQEIPVEETSAAEPPEELVEEEVTTLPATDGRPRLIVPGASAGALKPRSSSAPITRASGSVSTSVHSGALPSYAPKNQGMTWIRWLASPTVILVGLCFLLPLVSMNCQGKKLPTEPLHKTLFNKNELTEEDGENLTEYGMDPNSMDMGISMPFVAGCIWSVLGCAALLSLFAVMSVTSPQKGYSNWGIASGGIGVLVLIVLGYYLGVYAETSTEQALIEDMSTMTDASPISELRANLKESEIDIAEVLASVIDALDYRFVMDAGFYGMLAALLFGIGACFAPSAPDPGRVTWMIASWIAAVGLSYYGFTKWSEKSLTDEGADAFAEQLIEENMKEWVEEMAPQALESVPSEAEQP